MISLSILGPLITLFIYKQFKKKLEHKYYIIFILYINILDFYLYVIIYITITYITSCYIVITRKQYYFLM